MTKDKLIIIANNSKKLRGFAAKLCNYSDIHKDIFQDMLVYLISRNESELVEKYKKGGFSNYCGFILRRLNIERIRASKRINSKNTSVNITSFAVNIDELTNFEDINYNYKLDDDFDRVMDYINTDLSFEDFIILTESLEHNGLKELSKSSGVPYITLKTKRKQIKDKIKENVSI